jgi:hypothetical protein
LCLRLRRPPLPRVESALRPVNGDLQSRPHVSMTPK